MYVQTANPAIPSLTLFIRLCDFFLFFFAFLFSFSFLRSRFFISCDNVTVMRWKENERKKSITSSVNLFIKSHYDEHRISDPSSRWIQYNIIDCAIEQRIANCEQPKGNQILKSFKLKMKKKRRFANEIAFKCHQKWLMWGSIQNKILSKVSYSECVHFVWTTYNNSQRVNPFKNSVTLCDIVLLYMEYVYLVLVIIHHHMTLIA